MSEEKTGAVKYWKAVTSGVLLASKPDRKPITIPPSASIAEAADILSSNSISAAPVWDPLDHAFKGVFDFRDLCAFVLRVYQAKKGKEFLDFLTPDTELLHLIAAGSVADIKVNLVTNISLLNPIVTVKEGDYPEGLSLTHRVFVVGEDGGFKGVITQSDLIKYMYDHRALYPELFTKTLETFDVLSKPKEVLKLNWNELVIEALTLMHDNKVSSIALTDDSGKLVSVLSMTDIKYVFRSPKLLQALRMRCVDYVSGIRKIQAFEDRTGKDSFPFFCIRNENTLAEALGKIVATRCHRLFVVDDSMRPINVFSLTDLVQIFS